MITLKFPISLSPEDTEFIKELQRLQSAIIRSSYNMATVGLAEKSIRHDLKDRFPDRLDSWFHQSAVRRGVGLFKADHALGVTKKVFGGKKNLHARASGKLTQSEWKEFRLMPVYLIGESPNRGNRKFDFHVDHVMFTPWRKKSIRIDLPPMRRNWLKQWSNAVKLAEEKAIPITVSLSSTHICFSFDLPNVPKFHPDPARYAGIDLNPNYIGVSIFKDSTLIDSKLFDLSALTGKHKNENKITHETREIAHHIGRWLEHRRVSRVFVEALNFSSGSIGKGKNLNRLCKNQWKISAFTAALSKYFKLYEINAAYSSTIGNIMHPDKPDPIAASMEIARRGFEVCVKKSKKFYPDLVSRKSLQNRWKEIEWPEFETWKEIHDFIKNLGLRYRVPIPEKEGFRWFHSYRSCVMICKS